MIHAYLFITQNNRDREGHGPEFQSHMRRINQETGANITVFLYHFGLLFIKSALFLDIS